MSYHTKSLRGFVLLTTVVSLLAFSFLLVFALAQFSLSSNSSAQTIVAKDQALAYADSCAEAALYALRGDPGLSDKHQDLPTGDGCTIKVEHHDNQYTIKSEATVDTVTRRVVVEAIRDTNLISVSSWLEE